MKRTNGGAQWWSEDKSFYLALMLCLAAIAVAAYLLFAFPNGTSDDDTMQAQEYQADDSVTASEALERIPAMDPQPAPSRTAGTAAGGRAVLCAADGQQDYAGFFTKHVAV